MASYVETYLLNASDTVTVAKNTQTIVEDISLTGVQRETLTINGIVYELVNNTPTPINGVTVVVYDPEGTPLAQTLTETIGTQVGAYTLTFEGAANVNYSVTASLAGYDANTDVVTFTTTTVRSLSFLLNTDSSQLAIYGVVIDSVTSEPLPNAYVRIVGGGNTVIVQTMSDGTFFAYDSFQTGIAYTVTASQVGYDPQTQTVTISEGQIGRYVIFALNADIMNLTNIAGRVIVAGSNPTVGIANALVGLFLVDEAANPAKQLIATVTIDEYGAYTFAGVDGGQTYIVKATKIVTASNQ